jgi:hypothetical protein
MATTKKKPARKKAAPPQYVTAVDTFFPGRVAVTKGDVYDAKDDMVKRFPGKFEPVRSTVEDATAVPGVTRKVSVPK